MRSLVGSQQGHDQCALGFPYRRTYTPIPVLAQAQKSRGIPVRLGALLGGVANQFACFFGMIEKRLRPEVSSRR